MKRLSNGVSAEVISCARCRAFSVSKRALEGADATRMTGNSYATLYDDAWKEAVYSWRGSDFNISSSSECASVLGIGV